MNLIRSNPNVAQRHRLRRRAAGFTFGFFVAAMLVGTRTAISAPIDSLKVMTYNILVGGAAYGPLSRTVGVIQTAQADVIGIQESDGSTASIANALGYHYHDFNGDIAILSRYPIVQSLSHGVELELSPGQTAYVFDIHLAAYPYQPYDIRDGLITTEAQAIAAAQSARGGEMSSVVNSMTSAIASGAPVFLVGDFNEPSSLDWTQAAATAGLHFGKKVDWPASRVVANAGMIDAFRALRPDEVHDRGETWTPGSPAPQLDANEVHDRIDFVYYSPASASPVTAKMLGYNANDGNTDIAIQPYPSDHRSVVVDFDITASCPAVGDLNGDCAISSFDWVQFRSAQHTDLSGLTPIQARAKGDLNGDLRNDFADFVIFKAAYEQAHGAGSFSQMLSVPEPASSILAMCAAVSLVICVGRHKSARNKH